MAKVTVKNNPDAPIPAEIIAEAIRELAEALPKIRSHIKDKLIVLMLHDLTGVPKKQIQAILDVLPNLAQNYVVR